MVWAYAHPCILHSDKKHGVRDEPIRLAHWETGKLLFASEEYKFGHPIPGQYEISAVGSKSKQTAWLAQEGIYFSDNPIMS